MSTKEKAKELFDKMLFCYQGSLDEYTAKQCALIAVDEIIEVIRELADNEIVNIHVIYWQKIKEEIKKLSLG